MDLGDLDDLLTALFGRLRRSGLPLGIAELLEAHRAAAAGLAGSDDESLERLLRLLWCKSAAHNAELHAQLAKVLAEQRAGRVDESPPESPAAPPDVPPEAPPRRPRSEPAAATPETQLRPAPGLMPLPVRAPEMPAMPAEDALLVSADPVSHRTMAYTWHYLRRPVKDGPRDQLDVDATVQRTARQGFFDQPVLGRRVTDHGHLILLVDEGGSMVPFHRLTRELVETLGDARLGRVDVGYFQNTPAEQVYLDRHRTESIPLGNLLADCDSVTGVLIVSDAGAARGGRNQARFRATARVLVQLKQRTALLAWLNPVPEARWPGTTAQLIGAIVGMYPMDADGFGNAVDVLRGQAPGGRR
jgi:hypothetical protein